MTVALGVCLPTHFGALLALRPAEPGGLISFLRHMTIESIDLTERVFLGAQAPCCRAGAAVRKAASERAVAEWVEVPWSLRNDCVEGFFSVDANQ